MHCTKNDFRLEWFSGRGAGGQHRNKHQNCCRITHPASGLSATGQASRSRVTNQRHAFKALAQKLIAYYGVGQPENARVHMDAVVRTYHFERNDASDGVIHSAVKSLMESGIDQLLENALMGGSPLRQSERV